MQTFTISQISRLVLTAGIVDSYPNQPLRDGLDDEDDNNDDDHDDDDGDLVRTLSAHLMAETAIIRRHSRRQICGASRRGGTRPRSIAPPGPQQAPPSTRHRVLVQGPARHTRDTFEEAS